MSPSQTPTRFLMPILALFRSFADAAFEGICISESGRILDMNDQFAAMFGYCRDGLIGKELTSLTAPSSKAMVSHAIGADREMRYEFQALHKEGHELTVEAQARVSHLRGHKTRFTAVRDITERKRAEAELGKMNEDLVRASRLAGMGEVATSVLHNVGNVLSSISVSTDVITNSVKNSKAREIDRVAALLRQHLDHLNEFMTQDPKGRKLLPYLDHLGEHAANERQAVLNELHELRKHIEHMCEIITLQQGYAKVSGSQTRVSLNELIEDALRIVSQSLQRRNILVVREFQLDLPQVSVEKHAVMQILINLLRNAGFACEDSRAAEKRIVLRTRNGGAQVRIQVRDNGVGISPANIDRVFQHGFTTRKYGHGFGLHSSREVAQQLGGRLTAESEGLGKGAAFTLELPV